MATEKILFAEDDHNLGLVTKEGLEEAGFEVTWCKNGEEAWKTFGGQDLCLIDIMMPKMDGFTLAEKIREKDEFTPILFLTAKSLEEDRLRGFEIGGDDYISKPFSMQELVYRLQVFLKRTGDREIASDEFNFGFCQFDLQNLLLTVSGLTQSLTQREGELLALLLAKKNQLLKREEILEKIWGENDYFMGRSLDVFISRLRKYLKGDSGVEIKNHHGVGFVLSCK
ncbi:MAG: response regulator transcription factor [Cytophagales bacterium]|nr:response regulator transcription factor [Cytophagales bacterium]